MAVLKAQPADRLSAPVMAFVFVGALFGAERPAAIDEYQMKAAFVYNFAKFVEWPADAFNGAGAPLSICILGRNPFGRSLVDTIEGQAVNGRKLVVVEISDAKQASRCQVVFVSASEQKRLRATLADLSVASTLTIGDVEGFGEAGGIIHLVLEDGRVRFRINEKVAERQRLRISSKLLSLAAEVKK
jgi:hypothetical protein